MKKETTEIKRFFTRVWNSDNTVPFAWINTDTYQGNCIPVQKVKDKIEELNQYYKKEIHPSLYQWADITITEHYDEMIELLQELLEEGGENG